VIGVAVLMIGRRTERRGVTETGGELAVDAAS
jgi:hypothetical protein